MTDTANEIDPYAALQDKEPGKPPRNQWLDVWDQFKKHKGAVFGGGFLVFITLAVLLGAIPVDRGRAKAGHPQQERAPHLDRDLGWWGQDPMAPPLWHRQLRA